MRDSRTLRSLSSSLMVDEGIVSAAAGLDISWAESNDGGLPFGDLPDRDGRSGKESDSVSEMA